MWFMKPSLLTPVFPWHLRFRMAAEIGTGFLFLHQTEPEPLVHRDIKPGNILLDRNFVSKISDVGSARLVPPICSLQCDSALHDIDSRDFLLH
ncbi:hypothetical protein VitviT2T_014342 [Vitis vinifera]|uniref:RING-type E3 ubiquitin transferase n=1 Tax=Vitis vinifera TaxID=29760 RepID=A0ABY9CK37_VITVI|nr:hypothetical protein VitviT2T_014342 [Vitis vinifera]